MAVTVPASAGQVVRPGRRLLPVILLGYVLNIVDVFVVNVALPTLSRTLGAGPAELELVVAVYTVAYACLLVLGGRLGDAFGRRRLFITGMAGFTVASAICGLAPDAALLIVARVLQGGTAALMVPQVLATIQVFYQGAARRRAIGVFGATLGVSAAAGQILGGLVVSADLFGLSWRPIFLVNVPLGLLGILAARRAVPESRAPKAPSVDWPGTALLAATVLLLMLPLTLGRDENWPLWCQLLLAAAPFAAAGFAVVQSREERRGRTPLLPPSLLRAPSMRRGLLTTLAFFPAFGGMILTTTISLQYGMHLGPLQSGLTYIPYAVAFLTASLLCPRLVPRFGTYVTVAGALLLAAGFAITALQAWSDYDGMTPLSLAPALVVTGFGQGLIAIPLTGLVLIGVPAERAGVASGVLTTTQQTATALGVAAIGTLFFSVAAGHGFGPATVVAALVEAVLALVTAAVACTLPKRHP
ncbi:MFS transporter [Microbispora sp. CA-135349]|uniref:MFS transporter n=1 Tax=Microbispora sp. CA-135349 TaxID=3239953 RepID=UPI003D94C699